MPEIREYTNNNRAPFSDWLSSLDRPIKARVLTRIDRVRRGNFGDTKSVGEGVFELRLNFGPGYRVYFGRQGETLIILLCGGQKDSQMKDIKRAIELWVQHNIEGPGNGGKQSIQQDTT